MTDELHREYYNKWATAVSGLNVQPAPARMTWADPGNIAAVLELVKDTSNYLFLPEGGGVHFAGASLSKEPGCINLYPFDDGTHPYVTKVTKLHFMRPGEDLAWSYFVLEGGEMQPLFGSPGDDQESVFIEDHGSYLNPNKDRDEDGELLTYNGTRRLKGGLYLLLNNMSAYNELDDHCGKHNRWGLDNLEMHMRLLYEAFVKRFGSSDYLNVERKPDTIGE